MYYLHAFSQLEKKKWVVRVLLALILCLGLVIRLFGLEQLRLTQDEMSIGYNAFSIAQSGQDEWGQRFPLVFKAFGDWKLPGYIYSSVPFVSLFGLSNLSVKLPSLLAGMVLIWGLYLLVSKITDNHWLGLIAALITSLSPWSIHLSRMGFESSLALAIFILGLICLIKLIEVKKRWQLWAVLAGLFFSLTLYTYVAYRLFIILFLATTVILSWFYKVEKKKLITLIISFSLFLLPILPMFLGQAGTARFSQVGIFSDTGVVAQIDQRRSYCYLIDQKILPKICQLVFHKPQVYLERFVGNYLQFILPSFLFLEGDKLEYLSDPGFGEFVWVLLPFYLIGLIGFLKRKDLGSQILKVGFLLSPIASALVGEPQIVRGSSLLPFVIIFVTYGFKEVWDLLENKMVRIVGGVAVVGLFSFLTINFLVHYLFIYPREFQAYFFPMGSAPANFILENYQNYDAIYFTDDFSDAHILMAFLAQYDPTWYRQNIIYPQADKFGFQHPTKLGKFIFGARQGQTFLCHQEKRTGKMLYVTGPTEDLPYTNSFTGFSGVHTQVKIVDLDKVEANLKQEQLWETTCGSATK